MSRSGDGKTFPVALPHRKGSYLYVLLHSSPPQGSPVALLRQSSYGNFRVLLGIARAHKQKVETDRDTERREFY